MELIQFITAHTGMLSSHERNLKLSLCVDKEGFPRYIK